MLARVGALVGAIAMVVVAIVVRNHIDERAVDVRLTCSTELTDVCTQLKNETPGVQLTMEDAGTTADRLSGLDPGQDPGLDGWLTVGPWPEMVDAERATRGDAKLFPTTSSPVSSPLVAVIEAQRAATVTKVCGKPPNWACLSGLLPKSWGDLGGNPGFGPVKDDVPDPALHGDGLNAIGAMAVTALKDEPFSPTADPALQVVRNAHGAQLRPAPEAISTVLTTHGAELDTVTTAEAIAKAELSKAAEPNLVSLLYPAPVTSVVVQFGQVGSGKEAKKLAAAVSGTGVRALQNAGWKTTVDGTTVDAGILAALRSVWKQR